MKKADMRKPMTIRRKDTENIYCPPCGQTTRHNIDGNGRVYCPQCQQEKVVRLSCHLA